MPLKMEKADKTELTSLHEEAPLVKQDNNAMMSLYSEFSQPLHWLPFAWHEKWVKLGV